MNRAGKEGGLCMSSQTENRELILSWYDEYSDLIVKYIASMIKDGYQAEDIMQETFLKAFQYIEKNQIQYPKTFLFRIAHNVTIDYLRKQKPIDFVKELFAKDEGASVEDIMEVREESRELFLAIRKLKPAYKQVIMLRKIEEFSIADTASILNWSESKVKSTLFRALHALEKQLVKGGFMHGTS